VALRDDVDDGVSVPAVELTPAVNDAVTDPLIDDVLVDVFRDSVTSNEGLWPEMLSVLDTVTSLDSLRLVDGVSRRVNVIDLDADSVGVELRVSDCDLALDGDPVVLPVAAEREMGDVPVMVRVTVSVMVFVTVRTSDDVMVRLRVVESVREAETVWSPVSVALARDRVFVSVFVSVASYVNDAVPGERVSESVAVAVGCGESERECDTDGERVTVAVLGPFVRLDVTVGVWSVRVGVGVPDDVSVPVTVVVSERDLDPVALMDAEDSTVTVGFVGDAVRERVVDPLDSRDSDAVEL
jgi:hypothetical protein